MVPLILFFFFSVLQKRAITKMVPLSLKAVALKRGHIRSPAERRFTEPLPLRSVFTERREKKTGLNHFDGADVFCYRWPFVQSTQARLRQNNGRPVAWENKQLFTQREGRQKTGQLLARLP